MDRDETLRIFRAFENEGLDYVLIGAAAMSFHGVVRATEDLDLFVRATEENVERLKRAFRAVYANDPSIEDIHATDLLGDYPAVRYYPPSGDLYFDVMTRLVEIASFETVAAELKEIDGIRVRVATPGALYDLKKGTIRPVGGVSMAVQRFRSIQEMGDAPVIAAHGDGFERFARHCARYWKIAPRRYPRGCFRFRTLSEAQAARELVTAENATRLRSGADRNAR